MLVINVTNSWKAVATFINISGTWHSIVNIHTNINGTWRPLYTYAWEAGSFGACSATCGGGTQTRSAVCKRQDGAAAPDNYCTGVKPATSQVCNTHSCSRCVYDYNNYVICEPPYEGWYTLNGGRLCHTAPMSQCPPVSCGIYSPGALVGGRPPASYEYQICGPF